MVLGLTGVVTAVSATSDVLGIAASPGLIGAQLGYALQQALTGLVVLLSACSGECCSGCGTRRILLRTTSGLIDV